MAETSTAAAAAVAAAEEAEPKTVTLVSSDGEHFTVPEEAAVQSITIKNIVDDGCNDGPIPLPNVSSKVLSQVIVYLKSNTAAASAAAGEKEKEKDFAEMDLDELKVYILAANYLHIKSLTELVAQKIADKIKNKTPEEIRQLFGVKNDYTKEEEDKVRKENLWAFEDIEKDN